MTNEKISDIEDDDEFDDLLNEVTAGKEEEEEESEEDDIFADEDEEVETPKCEEAEIFEVEEEEETIEEKKEVVVEEKEGPDFEEVEGTIEIEKEEIKVKEEPKTKKEGNVKLTGLADFLVGVEICAPADLIPTTSMTPAEIMLKHAKKVAKFMTTKDMEGLNKLLSQTEEVCSPEEINKAISNISLQFVRVEEGRAIFSLIKK